MVKVAQIDSDSDDELSPLCAAAAAGDAAVVAPLLASPSDVAALGILAQPPPSFFSYSDIIASTLFSLALLLDGVIGLVPALSERKCYHLKALYGLFVVAIVTGFFSVLGMSIERFHVFAVVRDYSTIKRKFSIIWFLSSWTLSIVFVIILLPQIRDNNLHPNFRGANVGSYTYSQEHKVVSASAIFPGPHSATPSDGQAGQGQIGHQKSTAVDIIEGCVEDIVPSGPQIQNMSVQHQSCLLYTSDAADE